MTTAKKMILFFVSFITSSFDDKIEEKLRNELFFIEILEAIVDPFMFNEKSFIACFCSYKNLNCDKSIEDQIYKITESLRLSIITIQRKIDIEIKAQKNQHLYSKGNGNYHTIDGYNENILEILQEFSEYKGIFMDLSMTKDTFLPSVKDSVLLHLNSKNDSMQSSTPSISLDDTPNLTSAQFSSQSYIQNESFFLQTSIISLQPISKNKTDNISILLEGSRSSLKINPTDKQKNKQINHTKHTRTLSQPITFTFENNKHKKEFNSLYKEKNHNNELHYIKPKISADILKHKMHEHTEEAISRNTNTSDVTVKSKINLEFLSYDANIPQMIAQQSNPFEKNFRAKNTERNTGDSTTVFIERNRSMNLLPFVPQNKAICSTSKTCLYGSQDLLGKNDKNGQKSATTEGLVVSKDMIYLKCKNQKEMNLSAACSCSDESHANRQNETEQSSNRLKTFVYKGVLNLRKQDINNKTEFSDRRLSLYQFNESSIEVYSGKPNSPYSYSCNNLEIVHENNDFSLKGQMNESNNDLQISKENKTSGFESANTKNSLNYQSSAGQFIGLKAKKNHATNANVNADNNSFFADNEIDDFPKGVANLKAILEKNIKFEKNKYDKLTFIAAQCAEVYAINNKLKTLNMQIECLKQLKKISKSKKILFYEISMHNGIQIFEGISEIPSEKLANLYYKDDIQSHEYAWKGSKQSLSEDKKIEKSIFNKFINRTTKKIMNFAENKIKSINTLKSSKSTSRTNVNSSNEIFELLNSSKHVLISKFELEFITFGFSKYLNFNPPSKIKNTQFILLLELSAQILQVITDVDERKVHKVQFFVYKNWLHKKNFFYGENVQSLYEEILEICLLPFNLIDKNFDFEETIQFCHYFITKYLFTLKESNNIVKITEL